MSTGIITAFTAGVVSSPDGNEAQPHTPYSITLNAPFVHICQASANGIPCWRHAEIAYRTKAWLNFPSETRYLCKMHYALLWRMVLESLYNRAHLGDERGQVA